MTKDLSAKPQKSRRAQYLDMSLSGRMSQTAFVEHGAVLLLSAAAAIVLTDLICIVFKDFPAIATTIARAANGLFLLVCAAAWNCAWVRRLHDVGMSGLWLFSGWALLTLPFIGLLFTNSPHVWWLLLPSAIVGIRLQIAAFSPGEPGPNRYGPSPLEQEVEPEKVH